MDKIILILLIFFIFILIFPFPYRIIINYSIFENIGSFSFTFIKIKFKVVLFVIKNKTLVIRTKKKKKEIELTVNSAQIRFVEQLIIQIQNKIKLKYLSINSSVGLDDAMYSALLSAFVNQIEYYLISKLKCKKPYTKVVLNNQTQFNEKILSLNGQIRFSLSFFDLMYCLIMSVIITKRSDKYERI